jgi:hypothetical protein
MNRTASKIWRDSAQPEFKVNVRFSHELPGGDMLDVVAVVEPGRSNRPGDPEEEIQTEILECFLIDASGAQPSLPFQPDEIWLCGRDKVFCSLIDMLEDSAIQAYSDGVT